MGRIYHFELTAGDLSPRRSHLAFKGTAGNGVSDLHRLLEGAVGNGCGRVNNTIKGAAGDGKVLYGIIINCFAKSILIRGIGTAGNGHRRIISVVPPAGNAVCTLSSRDSRCVYGQIFNGKPLCFSKHVHIEAIQRSPRQRIAKDDLAACNVRAVVAGQIHTIFCASGNFYCAAAHGKSTCASHINRATLCSGIGNRTALQRKRTIGIHINAGRIKGISICGCKRQLTGFIGRGILDGQVSAVFYRDGFLCGGVPGHSLAVEIQSDGLAGNRIGFGHVHSGRGKDLNGLAILNFVQGLTQSGILGLTDLGNIGGLRYHTPGAVFVLLRLKTLGEKFFARLRGEGTAGNAGSALGISRVLHCNSSLCRIAADKGAALDHDGGVFTGAAVGGRIVIAHQHGGLRNGLEGTVMDGNGSLIGLAGKVSGIEGTCSSGMHITSHSLIDAVINVSRTADHSQAALNARDLHAVCGSALDLQVGIFRALAAADGIAPFAAIAGRAGGVLEGACGDGHVTTIFNGGVSLILIVTAIDDGGSVYLSSNAAAAAINGGSSKGSGTAISVVEGTGIGLFQVLISAVHNGEGTEVVDSAVAVCTGSGHVNGTIASNGERTIVGKYAGGEALTSGNRVALHIEDHIFSLTNGDGSGHRNILQQGDGCLLVIFHRSKGGFQGLVALTTDQSHTADFHYQVAYNFIILIMYQRRILAKRHIGKGGRGISFPAAPFKGSVNGAVGKPIYIWPGAQVSIEGTTGNLSPGKALGFPIKGAAVKLGGLRISTLSTGGIMDVIGTYPGLITARLRLECAVYDGIYLHAVLIRSAVQGGPGLIPPVALKYAEATSTRVGTTVDLQMQIVTIDRHGKVCILTGDHRTCLGFAVIIDIYSDFSTLTAYHMDSITDLRAHVPAIRAIPLAHTCGTAICTAPLHGSGAGLPDSVAVEIQIHGLANNEHFGQVNIRNQFHGLVALSRLNGRLQGRVGLIADLGHAGNDSTHTAVFVLLIALGEVLADIISEGTASDINSCGITT